jgi:DNA-binding transcriptional LysR family regulator
MYSFYQLRAFLEFARLGSVQEAAVALDVSQPAVSAALAGLQREIGVKLTERDGRGLRLTPAGKAFEQSARRIFALIEEAQREAQELGDVAASRLRIAAVTTAAEHLVPQMLQRFRIQEPHIGVQLDVGNHEDVWDLLRHWEVDVVVAGRPPAQLPMRSLASRPHELIVIGPADDRFASMPLGATTWLVRETGSGTRNVTEGCFEALGIDPPRLTIASNGAISACVRAGLGYSLVSSDAVVQDLQNGLLRQIKTPVTPLDRQWHLVVASDRDVPPAVERFVSFAIEACAFSAYRDTEPLARLESNTPKKLVR